MKTQLDGQKFHLSPLFPSSISPFSDHLLTPLNNPFIFFVYFISISLLAISMYALEDGEMREEDKKKEWGLQAKIQQVRHVLHFFFPPPLCFHCSFNLHPRGQQQHDPDISENINWLSRIYLHLLWLSRMKKAKSRENGEVSVWASNLKLLSGSLTVLRCPFLVLLSLCLPFSLCCDCVSLSSSNPDRLVIRFILFVLVAVCKLFFHVDS